MMWAWVVLVLSSWLVLGFVAFLAWSWHYGAWGQSPWWRLLLSLIAGPIAWRWRHWEEREFWGLRPGEIGGGNWSD